MLNNSLTGLIMQRPRELGKAPNASRRAVPTANPRLLLDGPRGSFDVFAEKHILPVIPPLAAPLGSMVGYIS